LYGHTFLSFLPHSLLQRFRPETCLAGFEQMGKVTLADTIGAVAAISAEWANEGAGIWVEAEVAVSAGQASA